MAEGLIERLGSLPGEFELLEGRDARPGLWWSQEFRLAEDGKGHFYDPLTGWPLVVRRRQDASVMVLVPSGAFLAGDEPSFSILPRRTEQTGAFLIDRHPVTIQQFERYLAATGGCHPQYAVAQIHGSCPASWTSYRDAEAYGEWVGARLPEALEWEKAARGTDGRRFPWGDEWPDRNRANYYWDEGTGDRYGFLDQRPREVGLHPRGVSPFGLLDMAGNVWEWCRDRVEIEEESVFRLLCESGEPAEGPLHPVRGGGFLSCTSTELAAAGGVPPRVAPETLRARRLGFRLMISLPSEG